jgi:uncharacterized protein (TIGR02145 family)
MKTKIRTLIFSLQFIGLIIIASSCKKSDTMTPLVDDTKIMDYDRNVYTTVTIGSQVWLSENLKTTSFLNGDPIPTTKLDISSEVGPVYQWAYNDDTTNVNPYGRLYTWYTVSDSRKICPTGFHVPSDDEFEFLKSFLGGEAISGGKLKESGTAHWLTPNTGATNETGFTALPGGYRTLNGIFVSLTNSGWLWSSSIDAPLAWGQSFHNDDNIMLRGGYYKAAGVSVRCLKDN